MVGPHILWYSDWWDQELLTYKGSGGLQIPHNYGGRERLMKPRLSVTNPWNVILAGHMNATIRSLLCYINKMNLFGYLVFIIFFHFSKFHLPHCLLPSIPLWSFSYDSILTRLVKQQFTFIPNKKHKMPPVCFVFLQGNTKAQNKQTNKHPLQKTAKN